METTYLNPIRLKLKTLNNWKQKEIKELVLGISYLFLEFVC